MTRTTLIWVTLAALITGAAGYWLGTRNARDASGTDMGSQRDILYWVAPMDPEFRRDEPGKSPMGMDLIPVYADSGATDDRVQVSPHIRQSLGVRTAPVRRAPFARTLATVGYAHWDQSTVTMVHPRAEGWLQSLSVASVGDRVDEGQVLYELFSPILTSAQSEYLTAIETGNAGLTRAARERLAALGVTRAQIAQLERAQRVSDAVPRRADHDAIVTAMQVRKGNYVTPATHILTLAKLDTVWIEVEVFERDVGWMAEGLPAQARFDAFPGQVWHGRVAYLYPELDPHTRTLRLRLVFDNEDGRLRPQMLARVRIQGEARPDVLQVPRDALIRAGTGTRVVVDDGDGGFRVEPVSVGTVSLTSAEILSGLREGESVVVSGQFLLDAEANGAQALARLGAGTGRDVAPQEAPEPDRHRHQDQDTMNGVEGEP